MASSALREVQYATESAFCENNTSPSSNTWSVRLPILSASFSPDQERQSDGSIQSRMNESRPGYAGIRSGTLEMTMYWCGYMADPGAGTLTETWQQDLLSDGLGGGNTADDGGTISSATDADTFVTTGVTGITPGNAIFVGAKGDGRGDGQMGVVSTWSAGNTQLLNAVAGTPNAADAVRPAQAAFPNETASVTNTKRFLVGGVSTGDQWHLMGCALSGLSFNLPLDTGNPPTVTLTYRVAYWDRSAVTIPSATPTMSDCLTAPIAGGSFHLSAVGTATRTLVAPTALTFAVNFGIAEKRGPAAGQANYQVITGYERLMAIPTLTMTIPWDSTWMGNWDTDGSSSTHYQAAWVSNCQAGRRVGFYMPRMYLSGMRPSFTDSNGLRYQIVQFTGRDGTDTTSELTRSAFRLFSG